MSTVALMGKWLGCVAAAAVAGGKLRIHLPRSSWFCKEAMYFRDQGLGVKGVYGTIWETEN